MYKRVPRWVAAISCSVVLALAASACTGSSSDSRNPAAKSATSKARTLQQVIKSGELRYGVVSANPPGFIHEKDGTWDGYFADMAKDIAKQLNLKPVPVETTYNNAALDLQAGKLDLMLGVQPTGPRALVVNFTTFPTFTNYVSVVASPSVTATTWQELNKPSVKIGVQTGSAQDTLIKLFAPAASISRFSTNANALLALKNGQVDTVAITVLTALVAVHQESSLHGHVIVPTPTVSSPSAAMVARTGDNALLEAANAIIWELNSTGVFRSLIFKYLGQEGVTTTDLPANVTL